MRPCAGAGSGDFAGARGKWAAAPKRCAGRKMGTGSRAMRRCLYPFSGDRIAQSPVDGGAVQMRPPFCDIPAAAASCALFCPRMTRHGDLIHTGGRATSATQQGRPRLLATCNRRAEVYPPWRGASGRSDGWPRLLAIAAPKAQAAGGTVRLLLAFACNPDYE